MEIVNDCNWYGDLTAENAEEVAAGIRHRLQGRYTSVAAVDGRLRSDDVRTGQVLEKVVTLPSGGVMIWDSSGGHCFSPGAYVELTYRGVRVDHRSGSGANLVWVFAVESKV